jgi:hypothetical protein
MMKTCMEGEGEVKKNGGGGELNYDIFDML